MPRILICSILLALCSISFAGAGQKLDGVVAVVGDEIIMQSDLDAYTAMRLAGAVQRPDSASLVKYRRMFLDELVDGKVLVAHAKDDTTIILSDDEVDRTLENHIAGILQQNKLTMDSLESVLLREQGVTLAKFKAETKNAIREQLLKQKVRQQYLSSIKVTRRDVEEFYARYRDSLPKLGESVLLSRLAITVTPPASVRQAAWEKILSIKQRLTGGADFGETAKRFSESPDAPSGGDLGFIEKGTLNLLAFEEKAFSLPPGKTSDPFETQLGFHIVNVVARQNQKVHVRQIMVRVAPPPEQLKKLTALLDSIRGSAAAESLAAFSDAVKRYSTDNLTKARGGNLGWKTLADLPAAVRSAIDTLAAGSIAPVVNDGGELALYRIDKRTSDRAPTLEDDWQVLAEKALDITAQKKLIELVARWRRQVYISIRI